MCVEYRFCAAVGGRRVGDSPTYINVRPRVGYRVVVGRKPVPEGAL